jgi:hypothetical protein
MQRVLLNDALKPETPPRERAQVARAWKELEELKRNMKMKPNPKPVEVQIGGKHGKGAINPMFTPPSEIP